MYGISKENGNKELKKQYQSAIEALIYENPDIFYLIGHFTSNLGYGTWFCGYDETTNEFIEGEYYETH